MASYSLCLTSAKGFLYQRHLQRLKYDQYKSTAVKKSLHYAVSHDMHFALRARVCIIPSQQRCWKRYTLLTTLGTMNSVATKFPGGWVGSNDSMPWLRFLRFTAMPLKYSLRLMTGTRAVQ